MKYIDEDGNKVIPVYCKDDNNPDTKNIPTKFTRAMELFAKTSFGKQILADFTPKGEKVYGVIGNGKYAQYDLFLYAIDYTNLQTRTTKFFDMQKLKTIYAQTQLREDDSGKPKFHILFDLNYSENELIETITHEFTVHLSCYENIFNSYSTRKKYEDALKQWHKYSQSKEHYDLGHNKQLEGSKNYYKTKNELIKLRPSLKTVFTNRLKELKDYEN